MIRTFLKCLIVSGGCLALFALAPAAFGVGFYNSVNVRDFGAVGDGVADDSAALEAVGRYLSTTYQMAGVYNHGAVAPDVIFPAGTYRITRVICWPGGYARSTPPPPGGVNGYRMIGYHFMRGQGGATIRQDNASADIFFLSGAYRTLIDNLTFQGGQRALKLNTYNVDSSSITIQNCRFQNSGDFAIECITRRAATATPPDPSEPDQFSMTEIAYQYSRYDMYDNGTIRGYLDNSTTVPLFYNSTQMCVSNTQFTNCKGIAYSTCDGFYITNCTMDTAAAMTGPAIRNGGIMVIDNVTAMVRLTPGNGQYWIEHIAFPCSGSVIVRNSTLTTDSATGVCPVYNRQKWSSGNATTQKLVVLEDSMFQVSGCPENCVVYCTEVPNIISIRNCTNSGASAVPALGFSTVPIPSYFSFYAWYWPYVGLGYTVDAANANITPNLPSSMVPYARVPLPEAQDMVIRTALQPNKEAFLSEATMEEPGTVVVNVTTYGAKGDAQTDDTVAIRNAIAAAGMNNSVELVFPAGRYCFSDTISLPARVTLRGQGCAAFIPRDMSKVCFRVNDAQRVAVYNCEFQQCAGALDVLISQPGAKILVKKCYFHWMESGTAIRCVGGALESDQTDLAKLRVTDCRFMGNKVCLLSNVSSVFDSTWIFNPFITTADNAALENYGSMRVECVCAVPNENDYRWIRNHGRLLVDSTRFSGEGGACTVENRRVAGISNIVVIQNSWLYNSISAAPKALIYCPNVPDQLILRTNEGLDIPELFSNNPATILVDEWPYDGQGLSSRIYFSGNTVPETVKAVTPPGMIYFDNFENDIAGINPANGNVQVATGQTATWSFITPNPSYIQVVSDTVTGNKVLRINYPAGAWERASLQVDVGAGLADLQSTQALVASFNIRYNRWTVPDQMVYKFLGTTAGQTVQLAGLMYNDASNSYPMISGTEAIMPTKPIVVGHWYQVKQVYDLVNNTFIGTITDLDTGDTGFNTTPQPITAGTTKIVGISFAPDITTSAYLDVDEVKLEIATTDQTFAPDGGAYVDPQTVVMASSVPEATIRYTTDGTDPLDNSTVYTAPVVISSNTTLKARAWATGYPPSTIKTATYVFPRPASIPYGMATVDGDLSDWDNATVWAPLDQDYYLVATDVPQAFYTARWRADKVYVAVKVQDTAHILMNSYNPSDPDSWNAADQVEIYLHTTGSYPDYSTDYSVDHVAAQQYVVGIQASNPNAVWSVLGSGFPIPVSAGFAAAGRVNGQWLQYEAAMTPFQTFNLSGTGLVTSPLSLNQVIDVDVVANSRRGPGDSGTNFGVKSENLLLDKYMNYRQIAPHRLGPQASYTNVDLAAVLAAMDSTQAGGGTWNPDADFDNDLTITSSDLAIVLANLP